MASVICRPISRQHPVMRALVVLRSGSILCHRISSSRRTAVPPSVAWRALASPAGDRDQPLNGSRESRRFKRHADEKVMVSGPAESPRAVVRAANRYVCGQIPRLTTFVPTCALARPAPRPSQLNSGRRRSAVFVSGLGPVHARGSTALTRPRFASAPSPHGERENKIRAVRRTARQPVTGFPEIRFFLLFECITRRLLKPHPSVADAPAAGQADTLASPLNVSRDAGRDERGHGR